ncbi:RHS repeat-associated core domain-containing protein [Pseudomonas sp. NFIX10]|uniref:RHS repeat-associated core domain-containing protein n=1 Tax=unclassified Pseudomonas TaxID=196821 RepID=UPI0008DF528E|nr:MULTISPECIES: RHS repeat-associated core domain-containing protein [unclassified Pseudomonas]SFB33074.1 RHS repeat-associated core domain-containing protein [Pseudomonas sp. NFIX10]SFE99199.1 RHS repeat-associated core domain-containing protein [Pseudomonas sp. NFACC06-1]
MPAAPHETVLCRYRYDPLDRLIDCAPSAEAGIQRFYCKSRLATEIQGAVQRSVFQHDDQLLAQIRREDLKADITLLATDHQRSVLNALDATCRHPLAYTPYGHRPAENGLLSLLGFNGERPDPVTGHYLLGNGYRAFNTVLMRFNSPDSWSPFGEGGVNAYVYCNGEPTNQTDPTGHFSFFKGIRSLWRNLFKSSKTHYKYEAQLAQRNATQKGLKLERIESELVLKTSELEEMKVKLTQTASELEATKTKHLVEYISYEGKIADQADEIAKLKMLNQTLKDNHQKLLSKKAQQPPSPARSRFAPPIPRRPVATLASQNTKNDLWQKQLAYLDLAQPNQTIRKPSS